MSGCDQCGNCGGCRTLELSEAEVSFLQKLAQIPFLPVARKTDSPEPIYLEDQVHSIEQYSMILSCLEKKRLISIDFDKPLKGCDSDRYSAYPIRGSLALTARGQQVLEWMEIQGISEES